jgi:hypothetical protein
MRLCRPVVCGSSRIDDRMGRPETGSVFRPKTLDRPSQRQRGCEDHRRRERVSYGVSGPCWSSKFEMI